MIVDVFGFYVQDPYGLRFVPMTPRRVLDSRPGAMFGPGSTRSVAVSGLNTQTYTIVGNLTAVKPTTTTFLTQWGQFFGTTRPGVSNVNAAAGETVANAVMTDSDQGTGVYIYNNVGYTDVLLDVMGRMDFNSTLSGTRSAGLPKAKGTGYGATRG